MEGPATTAGLLTQCAAVEQEPSSRSPDSAGWPGPQSQAESPPTSATLTEPMCAEWVVLSGEADIPAHTAGAVAATACSMTANRTIREETPYCRRREQIVMTPGLIAYIGRRGPRAQPELAPPLRHPAQWHGSHNGPDGW